MENEVPQILQHSTDQLLGMVDEQRARARKFKGMQQYLDAAGIASKDATTGMSLEQMEGMGRGVIARQEFQKAAADLAEKQATTKFTMQKLAEADALGKFGGDLGQFLQPPSNAPSNEQMGDFYENPERFPQGPPMAQFANPGGAPAPDLNAGIMEGLRRNPQAMASPQLDNILSVLEKYGGPDAGNLSKAKAAHLQAETMSLLANSPGKEVQPPASGTLGDGSTWYGFPGTHVRGILPNGLSQALDPNTQQPVPGMYQFGNRIVQQPQVNGASQQNADVNALVESEKAVQGLDRAIGAWNFQAAENKKDPKANPAPDPETLKDLQERRTLQRNILRKAGSSLSGPAAPAAPVPAGTAQPKTKAEYDKLPKGSLYTDPKDGKTYRKK